MWLGYKKVVLHSYALTKKERLIKNTFQDLKELLDHLKCGIGLGLVILNFNLWFTQVYSIPFFLEHCISVFSGVVQFQKVFLKTV